MAQSAIDVQERLEDSLRERVARLFELGEVDSDLALAERIQAGLPVNAIDGLMRRGVPEKVIFETVLPRRTYQRRRQRGERLSIKESDQAEHFARLLELATIVLGDEGRATRWLQTPRDRFGGRSAFALLQTSVGYKLAESTLLQAYFGLAA